MKIKFQQSKRALLFIIIISTASISCSLNLLVDHNDEIIKDTVCQLNETINLYDLLIKAEDLPSEWYLGEEGIGINDDRSWDSAGSYYYTANYQDQFPRLVTQMIYRHKTIDKAKSDYGYGISYLTGNTEPPSCWDFQSTIADESGIICRDDYCLWEARYECVVIEIIGGGVPGYVTIEDMENIVKLVDEKAGELLDINE